VQTEYVLASGTALANARAQTRRMTIQWRQARIGWHATRNGKADLHAPLPDYRAGIARNSKISPNSISAITSEYRLCIG
jgi:hypothetical protein